MSSPPANITIQGPSVKLDQLIQLRHAAKNIKLPDNAISKSSIGGNYRSTSRGRGMDFDEVRIYQAGDDIRNIDWRVTARTAKTHTKIFRAEKERPVLLAIDQRSSMFFGTKVTYKSVMATELASLLGWSTLARHDKIGGIVFNQHQHAEIKPKHSKHALLGLLKLMADFNQKLFEDHTESPCFTLHTLFEKIRRMAKPGTRIYIISDFSGYDTETEKLLYFVKRHTDIYALVVMDSMEARLPVHPQLVITDGVNKKTLDTSNRVVSDAYEQSFYKRYHLLEKSFQKIGIKYQPVWTQDNPVKSINSLLNGSALHIKDNTHRNTHAP